MAFSLCKHQLSATATVCQFARGMHHPGTHTQSHRQRYRALHVIIFWSVPDSHSGARPSFIVKSNEPERTHLENPGSHHQARLPTSAGKQRKNGGVERDTIPLMHPGWMKWLQFGVLLRPTANINRVIVTSSTERGREREWKLIVKPGILRFKRPHRLEGVMLGWWESGLFRQNLSLFS